MPLIATPRSKGLPPWDSVNMGRFLRSLKAKLFIRQGFVHGQRNLTTYDPAWDTFIEDTRSQEKIDRDLGKDYGNSITT